MAANSTDLEQLVVFRLAGGSYGVKIVKVNGIERMQEIVKVPKTADYVEGIINLRGKVIPVVNLRKIFSLPEAETTRDTRIVVVSMKDQRIGCLVDAVTEVLRIPVDSVEPPAPMVAARGNSNYLRGVAKLANRMILLLDLDKVLALEDALMLAEAVPVQNGESPEPPIEEVDALAVAGTIQ
ncbi:MAG: chemotaxis protein CheW [Chloroflexi bacterium]|nr:chemotaxis protein CheW [Chloroflexota bacterium]